MVTPAARPLSRGSISPSRKTISRSSSTERSHLYQAPDTDTKRRSSVYNFNDDFDDSNASDNGYDTDIEIETKKEEYDTTGRSSYMQACKQYDVIPSSYIIRHMQDTHLDLSHHGFNYGGIRAFAVPLVTNTKILKLDLSDNWINDEGGKVIANMLKENCYITELDLSSNQLGFEAVESICKVLQESNFTVQHLNLSNNKLDQHSAVPISNLLAASQKLESIDLSHNEFDETSGESLGFGISENTSLKSIDLSWNNFRGKGAVNLVNGISMNIFLKKVDISWNGLGLEGAKALKEMLINNNVLEEINISNNRIDTEASVEIGRGLLVNETLRVLDIGKNPMETNGCFAIMTSLLNNPQTTVETVYFTNILVNEDFLDLEKEVKSVHVNLKTVYTDVEIIKFPPPKVPPEEKVKAYIRDNGLRIVDFFNEFDKNHNLKITKEEFIIGIKNSGIQLSDEELEKLILKLDKDGDKMVNYKELLES